MRKILVSLFIIFATSSLVLGATQALWTDEVRVEGITFSSGTADLRIGDSKDSSSWLSTRGSGWWGASNMYPGQEIKRTFALKNTSSADIDLQTYVKVDGLKGNTGDFANYMELKLEWWDDSTNGWVSITRSLADWRGKVSGWNDGKGKKMNVVGGSKNPREYHAYLRLRSDAPDEHQGKTITFDLIFTGEQVAK